MAQLTYAATGHRPNKLPGHHSDETFRHLVSVAETQIRDLAPKQMITGMALGWDQAVAQACIELGVPFIAAIPFQGQEDLWPAAARARYRRLLTWAAETHAVSERFSVPVPRAMQKRNEWMVDRCNGVLALWDGSFGGTHNCIVYAKRHGRLIMNVWDFAYGGGDKSDVHRA